MKTFQKILSFIYIGCIFFAPNPALGGGTSTDQERQVGALASELKAEKKTLFDSQHDYAYLGDVIRPLLSFAMPGFDQFCNRQFVWGAGYAGAMAATYVWEQNVKKRIRQFEATDEYDYLSETKEGEWNLKIHDNLYREKQINFSLGYSIRSFSAYHSFRTAVKSRQRFDKYKFIDTKYEETPQRIWAEAFNVSYLKRPTTWGFLLTKTALVGLEIYLGRNDIRNDPYMFDDAKYAFGMSYLAGTGEEALNRGTIMPLLREYTGSYVIANLLQSTLFTLQHKQTTILQFGAGYYFGWQTKRNQWHIGESVFNHFWSDVISISATYMLRKKDDRPATVMLPLIHGTF